MDDGTKEGFILGTLVGKLLGFEDGIIDIDGFLVGCPGMTDGVLVGNALGMFDEGETEGNLEGSLEGARVGR